VPFERVVHGFYRAAQVGLSAELTWPSGGRDRAKTMPAGQLVAELVPHARQGLLSAGAASAEVDSLLDVISHRAMAGQTGAAWQRATLAALERDRNRPDALAGMFERYLRHADTGQPVHTWPACE